MKKLTAAGGVVALLAVALTGCSAGSGSSCQNKIQHEDATEVTMWAWYPDFKPVVDLFNKSHKDVQICWTNTGAGNDEYTKFTTAIQAGSGAPDVVMLESEVVPSYIADGSIIDLSKLGADTVKSNFSEGAWNDETGPDGDAYAIPVDGGPVGMIYRKDIFDKYGLTAPTTWDEFAADAKTIYEKSGGKTKITDFAGNGRAWQTALFSQAGWKPFDVTGKTDITIALDDANSLKVHKYWNDLVRQGLLGTEDAATTDYNTHLVDGTYATAIAAAWLPGYMKSYSGADADAVWAAAPIPQWDPNDPVQVNIGGSAFAVSNQAKDKKAAATVARDIFGTQDAWDIGISKASLFPLWQPALNSDSFVDRKDDFFGGQQVNKEVFVPAANGYKGFQFSPFQNFVYDKMTDAFNSTNKGKATPDSALKTLQKTVVDYAKAQGYTVTEG